MAEKNRYESPLCSRYASARMQYIFSPDFKFSTWRRLWIALAESEKELGLDITDEQIAQMRELSTTLIMKTPRNMKKSCVMTLWHIIHAYGDVCPKAMPIIHLGATSCYVGDNTDIIQMREGLYRLKSCWLMPFRFFRFCIDK